MFDPFSLMLMGGALGGLLDKKVPLRGAALGAMGGYFGPGLLGGASQAAAPVADAVITPVAGAAASPVAASAAPSVLSQAKPFMEAANTGVSVANMFKEPPQAPITPSPITPPTFNNAAGQMVAQNQQQLVQRMAQDKMAREQRKQMRGGLL